MTAAQIEEILNATSTGWWEYNVALNVITMNVGWMKKMGYAEEDQHTIQSWLRTVHTDDRADFFVKFSSHFFQDDCFEIELRMLDKTSNSYRWFSLHMSIVERNPKGRPLRVVGVIVSIEGTKKIEELEKDVQKKEQLILGLMRISFSSTSVYDFIHQKVINSQWRVLQRLGYSPDEFENVSAHFFEKILHPDDVWIINNHIDKIKKSAKDQVVECVFRISSKSGQYHWIALRDSVLRWDKNGNVCQLIGSVVDVTRYKTIKMQLDDNLDMLASLSYRNSHELRAPIATILGLINVIRHELQTDGSIQEFVDILEQTIIKMDQVIRDFGKSLHN